ncbi:hypothetical protein NHP21005_17150 [Helicobacter sp. NHP21005]|nr:hypothetical protein NHP21005_17150 [Helicobacter sp. NHP21005]
MAFSFRARPFKGALEPKEEQAHLQALSTSLETMQEALKAHPQIKELSAQIAKRDLKGYFFMGRGVFYPLVLEGALKLKEIAYVHAQGYASAEMKHGPIALADSTLLSTILLPKNLLFAKNLSNVEELSARDSLIFALSPLEVAPATFYLRTPLPALHERVFLHACALAAFCSRDGAT